MVPKNKIAVRTPAADKSFSKLYRGLLNGADIVSLAGGGDHNIFATRFVNSDNAYQQTRVARTAHFFSLNNVGCLCEI